MSVLSEQIFRFFYQGSLSEENIMTGSTLLMVSSLTVVLFTVVQATSSILQGVRKQRIPMYTLVAGVVCKIALNYTLVGIPGFNIHGAPISSLVCYTVSLVPNLYYVMKYTGTKFNWCDWLVRPGIATLAMGAAVCLMTRILPFSRLLTIVEVAVGRCGVRSHGDLDESTHQGGLEHLPPEAEIRSEERSMKQNITVVSLGPGDPELLTAPVHERDEKGEAADFPHGAAPGLRGADGSGRPKYVAG